MTGDPQFALRINAYNIEKLNDLKLLFVLRDWLAEMPRWCRYAAVLAAAFIVLQVVGVAPLSFWEILGKGGIQFGVLPNLTRDPFNGTFAGGPDKWDRSGNYAEVSRPKNEASAVTNGLLKLSASVAPDGVCVALARLGDDLSGFHALAQTPSLERRIARYGQQFSGRPHRQQ